jgi:putative methionine-R-sulfoxide reductase with GAF domain
VDEGSFQQLLAAAYVLQQHNDRSQSGKPEYGYARTLAGILEIQEQVRSQRLDLQATASLIARRVRELCQATGVAVGMLDHDQLEYYAASGSAAGEAGARAPVDSTLAAECLRTGQILQCPQAESDSRLSRELCRQLSVKALIAVPVSYHGNLAGVLELHFAQAGSFAEHDIRTCQLMAALLAEAIASDERPEQTASVSDIGPPLADERASLLAALEKLKPQLERLVARSPVAGSAAVASSSAAKRQPAPVTPSSTLQPEIMPATGAVCEACGHELTDDELFCGSCGVARRTPNPWASLWEMQRAAERSASEASSPQPATADDADSDALDMLPSEMEDIVASFSSEPSEPFKVAPIRNFPGAGPQIVPPVPASSEAAHSALTWTFPQPADSALHPEDDLPSFGVEAISQTVADWDAAYPADETVVPPEVSERSSSETNTDERITAQSGSIAWLADAWRAHRANIYVGVAALLLLAALAGWGTPETPPAHSGNAAAAGRTRAHVPPQPELSFLDKLLVDLGVAEAPTAPADLGNPETQVWIDVHTALYYCPGADLNGKTPGGRLATQRDAQQDQFQPAARRPCE